jgi:hypothetical protein
MVNPKFQIQPGIGGFETWDLNVIAGTARLFRHYLDGAVLTDLHYTRFILVGFAC